jgi:hypothetical protein
MDNNRLIAVEVTYPQVDRIGAVPQIDQTITCDEAPSGALYVVAKSPLQRAGQRVGWTITGRG